MNGLTAIDASLMVWEQAALQHPAADALALLARNQYAWTPLYAVALASCMALSWRRAAFCIVVVALTFFMTDFMMTETVKPIVGRLRPVRDPDVALLLRHITPGGSGFSFVSNHAANHFGFSMTLILLARPAMWARVLLLGWAALVAWAQVHVAVHYPSDVLAGAAYGMLSAWAVHSLLALLVRNFAPQSWAPSLS